MDVTSGHAAGGVGNADTPGLKANAVATTHLQVCGTNQHLQIQKLAGARTLMKALQESWHPTGKQHDAGELT